MPAPLAPRRTYAWVMVTVRYGGIFMACNSVTVARDAEDQFIQTSDVHGVSLHHYVSNLDATVTLEIPMNEKLAIDTLGSIVNAVDLTRLAGGNPGASNPPVPFFVLDPASDTLVTSAYARVAGHASDITFDEEGNKMRTFKILCPQCTITEKGYQAAI